MVIRKVEKGERKWKQKKGAGRGKRGKEVKTDGANGSTGGDEREKK